MNKERPHLIYSIISHYSTERIWLKDTSARRVHARTEIRLQSEFHPGSEGGHSALDPNFLFGASIKLPNIWGQWHENHLWWIFVVIVCYSSAHSFIPPENKISDFIISENCKNITQNLNWQTYSMLISWFKWFMLDSHILLKIFSHWKCICFVGYPM